jgi:hypothetical protein
MHLQNKNQYEPFQQLSKQETIQSNNSIHF